MLNKLKKISNKRKATFSILFIVILAFVLIGPSAQANWATDIVGSLARAIVSALGWILAKLMAVLIYVARYNEFVNAPAVEMGWVVARDIANMFFIVILLIISFATILQQEKYNYKQWLPKLILMAVLINFSKTICGLLIDISQVVMLTFVNAFSEIGAGSLTDMLGIANWQSLKSDTGNSGWELTAAYVLAVIYAVIALAVVAAMVAMLVMRIIMIWVYVVLSPFAYLLASFPGGANYSSKWWSEFTKNLLIGPVLAFFIWLSFASMGAGNKVEGLNSLTDADGVVIDYDASDALASQSTSDVMMKFIISIAMLIGGMQIAQGIGGAAGGAAGKTMGKLKGMGLAAGGAAGGYALAKTKWAGKKTAGGIKRAGGTVLSTADKAIGHKIDQARGTSKYGDRGLVGQSALSAKTFANRKLAIFKGKQAGSPEQQELAEKRRNYFEAAKFDKNKESESEMATMSHNGKQYRRAAEGDNKGKMVEVDEQGALTNNVLKASDGKEVKAMTGAEAAFSDAKRQNYRSVNVENNKAQEKKVDESKAKLSEMNLNSGEIDRKLASAATSAVDKMALAMIKASKGSFKTKTEVEEARKYVNANPNLSSKFNDEMDAKRPDLNYDFNSEIDNARFKKRLSAGKVDLNKVGDETLGNSGFLQAVEEQKGANFAPTIQKMVNERGANAKAQLSSGLQQRKNEVYANPNLSPSQRKDETFHLAKIQADINGDWGGSFKDNNDNLDTAALQQYVKSAKGKNLNNMSADDYKNNSDVQSSVRSSITAGQLSAMMMDGGNAELVRAIRDDILTKSRAGNIINPDGTRAAAPKIYTDIQANAALLSY